MTDTQHNKLKNIQHRGGWGIFIWRRERYLSHSQKFKFLKSNFFATFVLCPFHHLPATPQQNNHHSPVSSILDRKNPPLFPQTAKMSSSNQSINDLKTFADENQSSPPPAASVAPITKVITTVLADDEIMKTEGASETLFTALKVVLRASQGTNLEISHLAQTQYNTQSIQCNTIQLTPPSLHQPTHPSTQFPKRSTQPQRSSSSSPLQISISCPPLKAALA